jgi:acylphosphatase
MADTQAKVIISGVVQGVWYRAHTEKQARALGLKGYVKNLPSGQVEAVFTGPLETVEQAISWCHQGSPNAQVSRVEVKWQDKPESYPDFSIRY